MQLPALVNARALHAEVDRITKAGQSRPLGLWLASLPRAKSGSDAAAQLMASLLKWTQVICAKSGLVIRGWASSFADGQAICLLVRRLPAVSFVNHASAMLSLGSSHSSLAALLISLRLDCPAAALVSVVCISTPQHSHITKHASLFILQISYYLPRLLSCARISRSAPTPDEDEGEGKSCSALRNAVSRLFFVVLLCSLWCGAACDMATVLSLQKCKVSQQSQLLDTVHMHKLLSCFDAGVYAFNALDASQAAARRKVAASNFALISSAAASLGGIPSMLTAEDCCAPGGPHEHAVIG